MMNPSPVVRQSTLLTGRSCLPCAQLILFGIVIFNGACSTADPMENPSLSAALPEVTQNSSFVPIPTSEVSVVPSAPQESSTTPAVTATPDPDTPGTLLPEIPTTELATDQPGTEEPVEATVSRAVCSSSDSDMQQRLLELINDARATQRSCGSESYPATRALFWNTDLLDAAREHSDDMATHNFFDHTGSDGRSASDRVTGQGYRWRTVGENIAAGRETAAETVNDWLESPGHCRNIMNPAFAEVAVACVENSDSDYRRYWTNVLAAPL